MSDGVIALFNAALSGDRDSIMVLAAVYVFLVCGYSVVYQIRMRGWSSTPGRLGRAGMKKFGATARVVSDQEYIADALYEYVVDGDVYQGNRVSPWIIVASHNLRALLARQVNAIDVGPGGSVTVYYNPAKPGKSVLVLPGVTGIVVTFILSIGPLALLLMHGGFPR